VEEELIIEEQRVESIHVDRLAAALLDVANGLSPTVRRRLAAVGRTLRQPGGEPAAGSAA
jgi:hypothetical protein